MIHLLHSCVLALVLYLLYRFVLKGTQGFQAHRLYLLAIPLISFLLPLLVIPMNQTMVPQAFLSQEVPTMIPVIIKANAGNTSATTQPFLNLETLVWSIYGIGVATALLFFVYKLARIQQWKEEGKTRYIDGCYLTTVPQLPTAFSFLNHIYINDAVAKAQYDQILLHEKTHVKERHSWDLLFYEVLRILFWFHPVSYLAQQDLKLVHEHIADQKTIAVHGKQSYYENLLKQALDCPDFSFANPFFKSKTIKNRLTMIQKSQKSRFPIRKLLWMLPVLFASLTYTACTTEPEADIEIDAKMVEFAEGGKYDDVTKAEFDLIKKIKERDFLASRFKDDRGYFTLLEEARVESKTLSTSTIESIDIQKDNDESIAIVTYNDEKLYQGMIDTRGLVGKSDTELMDIIAESKNMQIIEEIVEVEEVESVNDGEEPEIIYQQYEQATDIPFAIIEQVPTYPGCSGNNTERKQCMQEKITRFVNENFNTGLANDLSLKGKQTISVQFKIDKNGQVRGVKTRAKAAELQTEAARVINMLPKMKPGMQRGKEVNVIYGLPIIFEVAG